MLRHYTELQPCRGFLFPENEKVLFYRTTEQGKSLDSVIMKHRYGFCLFIFSIHLVCIHLHLIWR